MMESRSGKSQVDIDSLRETLCIQQRLLQKLYIELDAEREAASTSASEALSMILRLQGEKATMKMELEQYKRYAEEKMYHAEEYLAIYEDVIHEKEMEVTAMDCQVQAYRYKLLSMGCDDPGNGEIKFPETLLQIDETLGGEISLEGIGRRNSAPPVALKRSLAKKVGAERDNSLSPEPKISEDCTYHDISESSSDFEKKTDSSSTGGMNSYWEEIKKLEGRVKEIAGVSYVNTRSSTRSPSPQLSSDNSSHDLTKGYIVNEVDIVKHPDSGCSTSVMDVFEVPPVNCNADSSHHSPTKYLEKRILLQGDDKLQHPTCVPEENVQSFLKHECDLLKKRASPSICDNVFCRPNDGGGIRCNMALIQPSRLQMNLGSEIVEVESQNARQESEAKEEQMRLLNEIREQLNSIQSQIRGLKTKQPEQRDDTALVMLAEDMLHFWL